METAYSVIADALKEIGAFPAESEIPSDDAQIGIFYLNAMMGDYAINGVNIGYTPVSSLGDVIDIDLAAIEPMVKNLAIQISPLYYDTLNNPELFSEAEQGFRALLDISIGRPAPAPYDERFPVGSGNYDDVRSRNFYDPASDPILTEGGGRVGEG